MENIEKYCKQTYGFLLKSKNKAEWLQVLSGIDKIEQNHEGTKFHAHWIGVYDYMKKQYNLLFKK